MTDIEFKERLNEVLRRLRLSDEQAARNLRVAPGTVRRWRLGITATVPEAMPTIFRILESLQ